MVLAWVWLLAVWCCVLWGERQVSAADTSCPSAFLNRCSCGMGYSPYDGHRQMRYTVNCTNSGFRTASMLQSLPEETEVFIFTGNTIPTLPINMFNKTLFYNDLDVIDMSNNHIRFIQGKTFHRVYSVKTLILNHNDLDITNKKERPRLFSSFDALEELHLTNAFSEKINSSDYLLSLEDIFYESTLDLLKTLHLEQNEIWTIGNNTGVFCQLPKLQDLFLTDNRLRDFDFRIDCLHSLRYINLERNMIARLSDDAMGALDNFNRNNSTVTIRMQQNIFDCDCRSKKFIQWLNTTKVNMEGWSDLKCVDGYPSTNIGKTLSEIYNDQQLLELLEESDDVTPPVTTFITPTAASISTPVSTSTSSSTTTKTKKRASTSTPSTSGKRSSKPVSDDTDSIVQEAFQQLKALSSSNDNDGNSDFGNVVANDLRQMSNENKIYAQKLINDILFLGKLGKLSSSTMIVE